MSLRELGGTVFRSKRHVVRVNLFGSKVTDDGLLHLKGLTGVRVLDLSKTQVTDGGLVHLKGMTNLIDLRLAKTKVTGAGLEHLKGLYVLKLNHTKVRDAGLRADQNVVPVPLRHPSHGRGCEGIAGSITQMQDRMEVIEHGIGTTPVKACQPE